MGVISYADIGKAPKDLLTGARGSGVFQFDPKITVATTTSTGVTFTATAVQKAEKVDATLKAAYSGKGYSLDAMVDPSAKINVNGTLSGVAPGVKLSVSALLPDPSSGKLSCEYSNPYVHLKSTVGMKASPVLDLLVATGYQR
jgi:voltage-dependent anion channel protein 2